MCELEPHASHTCSLSHHNHSHFGKKLQLKAQSFPFKLYTMAGLSIASELENAGSLIEVQVAAGMGEADVKEILARSYEARITELPTLSSEQKAKLTSAINGGPWTTEQRKMLASAVLNNGSRKRNAASMSKRLNQKCHNIENLIPTTYMVKLKDTDKYSEISRLSIIAAAAKTIGIVNPDETTLFRMVSIVAACAPASSFSQREVWDHMSTIQKFIKAGAASKLEYLSNFPPTAELLPEAIQTAAYAGEPAGLPPTLQWAELDTVLGDMKQRGSRSSPSSSSSHRAPLDQVIVVDSEAEPEIELPISVLPYKQWTRMVDVVRKCEDVSKPGHNIAFDLPHVGVCDSDEKMSEHIAFVVNDGLSERGITGFKFGISFTPYKRFTQYNDYRHLKKMVICGVSEEPDRIADLETLAISKFRSDDRCRNIKPGGESSDHGMSPFFLYVVFGSYAQFKRGRDAAREFGPYVGTERLRS